MCAGWLHRPQYKPQKLKTMKEFYGENSKYRMVVFLKDNDNGHSFKSAINEDKKGFEKAKSGLVERIVNKKFKGQVKTAIFYDNITGKELSKMVF